MTVVPMPERLEVAMDRDTRELDGGRLLGGMPRRMLRLSEVGRVALAEIHDGPIVSAAGGQLARRLTDAGLAHPRPVPPPAADVTVVVPVRDRLEQLARCLASLGEVACVVVDDGSSEPDAIAEVARRHGARVIRREVAGGPAVARNAAVPGIATELIAFIDSDCIAAPGWVEQLAGHFADPLVGAVAPRVVPLGRETSDRYLDRVGLHDLGDRESRVEPLGRVAFVPTAALVVRRSVLEAVAPFDPALRYGEDVDLVWRLDAAGWRVRYDPSVEVMHDEPTTWRARLGRRFHYGSAAAPLSRRHPNASAHLIVSPVPLAAVIGVLIGRRSLVAAGAAATVLNTSRALQRADVQELPAARLGREALAGTWQGVGRYATQFGLPLLAAAAWRGRRSPRRTATVLALAIAPAVADWAEQRPGTSLPRYVAGRIADDAAYGAGVYAGCLKERTVAPLRVVMSKSTRERNR